MSQQAVRLSFWPNWLLWLKDDISDHVSFSFCSSFFYFFFMPSTFPHFSPPFAYSAPASRLWCVCQQHSCLEQSARADICRTVSLIWSATWSVRVTKSSSRQSRHCGRRFLCGFALYASLSLIKILIAYSGAHARVFQLFAVSVSGSVCRADHVALPGWHRPMSAWWSAVLDSQVQRAEGNVGLIRLFVSYSDVQMIWKEDFLTVKLELCAWGWAINDKTNDRMKKRVLIVAVGLC